MKRIFNSLILVMAGVLLTHPCFAQKKIETAINKIKNECQIINAYPHQSRSFPYKNSCGVIAATLTLYYYGNRVVKIIDKGKGDDDKAAANWVYEYYYKNGKLIFAYETITGYNMELEKETTHQTRQYFQEDKLIKTIEDGKAHYPAHTVITSTDKKYLLRKVTHSSQIAKIYTCKN